MALATANSWLALVGCLILIGVVASMDNRTCHGIRWGVVLIFAGMSGDFLSLWFVGWGPYVETMLYTGLIVFVGADRRHTTLTLSTLFRSRNRRQ
jgi:hypothetical protein